MHPTRYQPGSGNKHVETRHALSIQSRNRKFELQLVFFFSGNSPTNLQKKEIHK
jgi:hypothetical protein